MPSDSRCNNLLCNEGSTFTYSSSQSLEKPKSCRKRTEYPRHV
uniref:Uncharacterized protein n=1 Tax=Rhizophora mucronata TaxID=61149 RepID=A0A2P2PWE4_RHIMU